MNVFGTAPSIKKILSLCELDIPSDARILDIGCGTGLATEVLTKRFPASKITGLDCSKAMLEKYREHFPKAEALYGDFNVGGKMFKHPFKADIEIKPESFDLIVSSGAVSEYGEPGKALPNIFYWLKKNGVFFNIGVRNHKINALPSKVWKYVPKCEKDFLKECKKSGFENPELIFLDIKFFPSNILKYVVSAKKN